MGVAQAEEKRSLKRQRTETTESVDFVFDKNFHFDDGNIILAAEGTAFKIHKSVLSWHSAVFCDMFLANGNSPPSEIHEGCGVLRVSDSKQDMVCLLQALYDVIVPSSDKLVELSCLLRISNKYLIRRLLTRTLETIEKAIPITYEGYKATVNILDYTAYGHNELTAGVTVITAGINIFLPILYYKFSTCRDPSDLEILPAPSIAKILTGTKPILTYLPIVLRIVKMEQSKALDTCSSSTCRRAWENLISTLEYHVTFLPALCQPLDILILMCRSERPKQCSSCRDARIGLLDAEARKIWDQLPKIYNVAKSWDELREKYKKLKESDNEISQQ